MFEFCARLFDEAKTNLHDLSGSGSTDEVGRGFAALGPGCAKGQVPDPFLEFPTAFELRKAHLHPARIPDPVQPPHKTHPRQGTIEIQRWVLVPSTKGLTARKELSGLGLHVFVSRLTRLAQRQNPQTANSLARPRRFFLGPQVGNQFVPRPPIFEAHQFHGLAIGLGFDLVGQEQTQAVAQQRPRRVAIEVDKFVEGQRGRGLGRRRQGLGNEASEFDSLAPERTRPGVAGLGVAEEPGIGTSGIEIARTERLEGMSQEHGVAQFLGGLVLRAIGPVVQGKGPVEVIEQFPHHHRRG